MSRFIPIAAATLVLIGVSTGCGTVGSMRHRNLFDLEVYSGVRTDVHVIANPGCKSAVTPLFIADLPLSLTADTVLLPVTVPGAIIEAVDDIGDWLTRSEPAPLRAPPPTAPEPPRTREPELLEASTGTETDDAKAKLY